MSSIAVNGSQSSRSSDNGTKAALQELADEIKLGEDAIMRLLQDDPSKTWRIRELQDQAAEGRRATIMRLALINLESADKVSIDFSASNVYLAA